MWGMLNTNLGEGWERARVELKMTISIRKILWGLNTKWQAHQRNMIFIPRSETSRLQKPVHLKKKKKIINLLHRDPARMKRDNLCEVLHSVLGRKQVLTKEQLALITPALTNRLAVKYTQQGVSLRELWRATSGLRTRCSSLVLEESYCSNHSKLESDHKSNKLEYPWSSFPIFLSDKKYAIGIFFF